MQKIIVDGYNVIHADPELKRAAVAGMQRAREALLSRLRDYLASRDVQVTVVFDGAGGIVDAEPLIPGRLQVLYSARGQSADEVIVDTLRDHANAREYIVVTSDMADIGRAVMAEGASLMASADFLDRIRGGDAPTEAAREKPDPSEEDVDYWLGMFGEDGKNGEGDE
jgi:predicted RNA-binding protein with PIN domain